MFEPEHVGALALTGEIFIRRGMYEEAADNLSRLATIDEAPAKNRVTAGIAAVDLYEEKLDRYDRALEVLVGLHRAGLSTLPSASGSRAPPRGPALGARPPTSSRC